jgi:hypothetical protein
MTEERSTLENRFHSAFVARLAVIEKETNYDPKYLKSCIEQCEEGYSIAVRLFEASKAHEGFFKVAFNEARPDLTIEALVIDSEEWKALFTPKQLDRAIRRLKAFGYPQAVSS